MTKPATKAIRLDLRLSTHKTLESLAKEAEKSKRALSIMLLETRVSEIQAKRKGK